ncbi:MAG: hypothetical protein ABFS22_09150 [Pseudomonadota bacterium]
MVNQKEEYCIHFLQLPCSLRLTFTLTLLVLGMGYLFAMINLYDTHAGRDGRPGISVTDLVIAYSGSKADTRLEAALKGPMQRMLSRDDRDKIIAWIYRGAVQEEYEKEMAPIIEEGCRMCHDGSDPHVPSLISFQDVSQFIEIDTGMDIFTLVRVSHIHLFGMTFIFFITSLIFCHAHFRLQWLKHLVITIPFVSIILDVASWYLTKIHTAFAWVVLISGALMGLAFAFQWFVSLYQMWFYQLPDEAPE